MALVRKYKMESAWVEFHLALFSLQFLAMKIHEKIEGLRERRSLLGGDAEVDEEMPVCFSFTSKENLSNVL